LLAREYRKSTGWWPTRAEVEGIDHTLRSDVLLFDEWVAWTYDNDNNVLALRRQNGLLEP
jgi:hypothetical protein